MSSNLAAIWSAVSSTPQADRVSLAEQSALGEARAIELGFQVARHLVVPGISREYILFEDAAREIQAYADLRNLLEMRAIQLLVFYRMDRLGRTNALCQSVIALCLAHGCAVYNLSAPPSSIDVAAQRQDSSLSLMSSFAGWQAQDEMQVLRRRHESGMRGRAKRGLLPNIPPYGLRREGDGYAVVPHEAQVIRDIVRMYLAGESTWSISEALNEQGVPPPSNGTRQGVKWYRSTISRMLQKCWTYAGYAEVNRLSETGREYSRHKSEYIPKIISEQEADAIESLTKFKRKRRHSSPPHILSGVCRCDCDHAMVVDLRHVRVKCLYCGKSMLIKRIMRQIEQAFLALELTETYEASALRVKSMREELEVQLDITLAEIERVETRKQRADDAYVDGFMPSLDYRRQASRLNTELKRLHATESRLRDEIGALPDVDAQREVLEGIAAVYREVLGSDNPVAANQWMRQFVAVEVLSNERCDVTLG